MVIGIVYDSIVITIQMLRVAVSTKLELATLSLYTDVSIFILS